MVKLSQFHSLRFMTSTRCLVSSNPGRTNTHDLKITEQKMQSLLKHLQTVRLSCLLGYGR